MREMPFTRSTVIDANELVAAEVRTHTQINKIVLRIGWSRRSRTTIPWAWRRSSIAYWQEWS